MKMIPLVGEFKPILKYVILKVKEKDEDFEEESDEEDLMRWSVPREQAKLSDEDDREYKPDSILYFSIKLLIAYESFI